MDLSQNEYCAKCNKYPEDILMLTCNHDLCLQCAARCLQKEEQRLAKSVNYLACDICKSTTLLEDSSLYELKKLYPAQNNSIQQQGTNPKKSSIEYKPQDKKINNNDGIKSLYNVNNSLYQPTLNFQQERPMSNNTLLKQTKRYCIDHPEEEISYFCFDCMCNCICPECVIHGSHKNHNVMTIKKAYHIVRGKTDDLLSKVSEKINEFKISEDKLILKKKEIGENNKMLKKQIAEQFNEIRIKIDKKEREILSQAENLLSETFGDLEEFLFSVNDKINGMIGIVEQLNIHMIGKDDALLLNFFSQNAEKIVDQLKTNELTPKKLAEAINVKPLLQQVEIFDQLNLLQNQINGLFLVDRTKSKPSNLLSNNSNIMNYSNIIQTSINKQSVKKELISYNKIKDENYYNDSVKYGGNNSPNNNSNTLQYYEPNPNASNTKSEKDKFLQGKSSEGMYKMNFKFDDNY